MTPFAEFLQQARRLRSIKQRELAHRLGMSAAYVSGLETGKKPPPSLERIELLAQILSLSAQERSEMTEAVRDSNHAFRMPPSARPIEYRLLNRLFPLVGQLSRRELAALEAAIATRQTE